MMLKPVCCTLVVFAFALNVLKGQQPVKISGTSEDMKENHISVRWPPNFVIHERKISVLSEQGSKTGEFALGFTLKKPEILIFGAYYKNWFIYFKPGESATFKITGNGIGQKLIFSGKEANRYNLDVMISEMTQKVPVYRKNEDLVQFKAAMDEWKKASEVMLKSYLLKHTVNREFGSLSEKKLQYKYVQAIYAALNYSQQEALPAGYLLEASKYSFAQDELLSLIEYRNAVYYKYIAYKVSEQRLDRIAQDIETELKGKTRDFALSYLAGEYAVKESAADSEMLRSLFNRLYKKKLDGSYLPFLKDNEMRYFIVGKPLPDSVLNNTLLTGYGSDEVISLAKLLDSHQGKGVYIDLWASWCFPCRDDISKSSEIKGLLNEGNVSYLYFSTDKDKGAWEKASRQDKITDNQYLLRDKNYKQFKAFIELNAIPRYIILDKNHNVISLFAPGPTPDHKDEFGKVVDSII